MVDMLAVVELYLLRGVKCVFCLPKAELVGADTLGLRYGVVMFAVVLLFGGVGVGIGEDLAEGEERELQQEN